METTRPEYEEQRLAALRRCHIMDTPPEEAYDDMIRLAAAICETPIAAISLVDEERQWFKSILGIDTRETSRASSFCSSTILQSDLMIVPDAQQDERFIDNPLVTGDPHIRFYAGAPLVTGDGYPLGSLCVIDRKPRELTEHQKTALRILARQASTQIDLRKHIAIQKDLMQERARAEERFRVLFEESSEPHLIFGDNGIVDCNQAFLDLLGCPEKTAALGLHPRSFSPEYQPDGRLSTEKSREMDALAREHGSCQFEWMHRKCDGTEFPVQVTLKSVIFDAQPMLLTVWHDLTERKAAEQQITDYAIVLEYKMAELEDANRLLETLATTDGLTGLRNHRIFQEMLAQEFHSAARYQGALSLIMLDVDRFKEYNDFFGHPEGDAVLRQVAQVLKGVVRECDILARYGGEEFVIVLPQTGGEGAGQMAERCRQAIADASWERRPVTASFGVATLTPDMPDCATLLAHADEALYIAKAGGRNCVAHIQQALTGEAFVIG